MFIRVRKSIYKSGKTVNHYQLVESCRKDGKVISKVICTMGYEPTVAGAIAKFRKSSELHQRLFERYSSERDRYQITNRYWRINSEKADYYQKKVEQYESNINKLNEALCSGKIMSTTG